MSLFDAVFAAALALPAPTYRDTPPETPSEYVDRIAVIAEAVTEESTRIRWAWGPRAMAAAVLVVMYNESRFDVRIHAGDPHPRWTSDDGAARCLSQVHVSGLVPLPEWLTLAGTDRGSTRRCVAATARLIRAHVRHCAPDIRAPSTDAMSRALASYGSGGRCIPTASSLSRAGLWARLMARL